MGKIFAEITMSVDGFIAGPNITNNNPMGTNGPRLHEWIFDKATEADRKWLAELMNTTGAVITGNHTYSTAIDDAWGQENPFNAPAFVICHAVPAKQVSGFSYVTAGIEKALELARKAAGKKNIWIMGGANVIQQYLKAGLVEELRLHIAPILLKEGTKLFDNTGAQPVDLEQVSLTETPGAAHIVFRVK